MEQQLNDDWPFSTVCPSASVYYLSFHKNKISDTS